MRSIDKEAAKYFWRGQRLRCRNTDVRVQDGVVTLLLHGNAIVRRPAMGTRVEITANGYASQTTKSRINAVLQHVGCGVQQNKGMWFLHTADAVVEMCTSPGIWTEAFPGGDLEQLARAFEEGA